MYQRVALIEMLQNKQNKTKQNKETKKQQQQQQQKATTLFAVKKQPYIQLCLYPY